MTDASSHAEMGVMAASGVPAAAPPMTNGPAYAIPATTTYRAPRVPARPREPTPHRLSRRERRALFDRLARRYLHMSGDEFIRAWDAGAFSDDPDRPEVMRVAMLIDFGR